MKIKYLQITFTIIIFILALIGSINVLIDNSSKLWFIPLWGLFAFSLGYDFYRGHIKVTK